MVERTDNNNSPKKSTKALKGDKRMVPAHGEVVGWQRAAAACVQLHDEYVRRRSAAPVVGFGPFQPDPIQRFEVLSTRGYSELVLTGAVRLSSPGRCFGCEPGCLERCCLSALALAFRGLMSRGLSFFNFKERRGSTFGSGGGGRVEGS